MVYFGIMVCNGMVYGILWFGMVHGYYTVWYGVVYDSILWFGKVLYGMLLIVFCGMV